MKVNWITYGAMNIEETWWLHCNVNWKKSEGLYTPYWSNIFRGRCGWPFYTQKERKKKQQRNGWVQPKLITYVRQPNKIKSYSAKPLDNILLLFFPLFFDGNFHELWKFWRWSQLSHLLSNFINLRLNELLYLFFKM